MGKVRSKKCSKIARTDPTGLGKVDVDEEDVCQDLGPVSSFVQTVLEQLRSHLVEERDSGLNSLSAAASKQVYMDEILKSDIFKVVGPLLLDPSVSVRHSAAGALRNLSSVSMDVCERMISASIMTPLVAALKKNYSGEWAPTTQNKEKKSKQPFRIDSTTETLIEIITLLWNLCETGDRAVKIFNEEQLGDMLARFLNVETYGIKVSLSTALCLYSATEDNLDGIRNKAQLEELLMKIFMLSNETVADTWNFLYLQTTAVGIIVNMNKGDLRETPPDRINLIMSILNKSLDVDHLTEVNKFSSDVPLKNGNHQEMYHRESESDLKKVFELDEKCDNMTALISSQIMSLEILSNIIISDDDEMLDEEDDDDSVESITGDDFQEDDGMTAEDDVEMKDICTSDIPTEVYENLSSTGTLPKVLHKIKSLPVNVRDILSEDETRGLKIVRKCNILRSTALICLQNLMEVLSLSDLEKCIPVVELWTGLGSILTECDPSDETMIEAITSAMRAVIQSTSRQKNLHSASNQLCTGFSVFNQVYESVSILKVKVNIIRIIGCIGLQLSKFPKDVPVTNNLDVEASLTEIAEYLLTCLTNVKPDPGALWLAAEIIDTIFDTFAEDDYNHVLSKVGLIPKLKSVQPVFKKQVRSARRSLGENAAVITTANTNLPKFIQYKEKHGVS